MGRTVVVRDSYTDETRKLDWMEKSIQKDSRIEEDVKLEIIPLIECLRSSLIQLQVQIDRRKASGAEPVSDGTS